MPLLIAQSSCSETAARIIRNEFLIVVNKICLEMLKQQWNDGLLLVSRERDSLELETNDKINDMSRNDSLISIVLLLLCVSTYMLMQILPRNVLNPLTAAVL